MNRVIGYSFGVLILIGVCAVVTPIAVTHASELVADHLAQSEVSAVAEAQETASQISGVYLPESTLLTEMWLPASPTRTIHASADGSCYVTASISTAGHVFWLDNDNLGPRDYISGVSASTCVDLPALVVELSRAALAAPALNPGYR